ncbi:hypothetical protein TNCV_1224041 [Trichonephila clavipes]|nr:hypothetical protein TNCV_1224041 [Trichonephila clavipes]
MGYPRDVSSRIWVFFRPAKLGLLATRPQCSANIGPYKSKIVPYSDGSCFQLHPEDRCGETVENKLPQTIARSQLGGEGIIMA